MKKCGIQQKGRICIYIKNIVKQTGYRVYKMLNSVKIQIRLKKHCSAAQGRMKLQ